MMSEAHCLMLGSEIEDDGIWDGGSGAMERVMSFWHELSAIQKKMQVVVASLSSPHFFFFFFH
jgi:hypothetical protein